MTRTTSSLPAFITAVIFGAALACPVAGRAAALNVAGEAAKLGNGDNKIAVEAARNLSMAQSDEATAALAAYLRTGKNDYVKTQIIEMLAGNSSSTATKALVAAARDRNPYVRKAAIRSLGFGAAPEGLSELQQAVSRDTDGGVRRFALYSLRQYTSTAAVETADRVLADRNNAEDLRMTAAQVLAAMNSPEAQKKLEKYGNDTNRAIREEIQRSREAAKVQRKKRN